MAFPPQYFYSVLEASARWGCSQAQIVDWAIADEIELVVAFSEVWFGDESACGLMIVPGSAIRPLFRPHGRAAKKVYLHCARPSGSAAWQTFTSPREGFKVVAADILITATEIERFESRHGIGRRGGSNAGAPSKYDWEGFYRALLKRIYTAGMPERQRDLIVEMQNWFITHSEFGEAPDESTIRRRIQSVWQDLKPE